MRLVYILIGEIMKIEVQAESSLIIRHIEKYLTDIVYNQQVTEDTHFIVCEKFFFRNSSRVLYLLFYHLLILIKH